MNAVKDINGKPLCAVPRDPALYAGDVVLCPETVSARVRIIGRQFRREKFGSVWLMTLEHYLGEVVP